MIQEDTARRNHEAKAKAMDIGNILQEKLVSFLQKSVSLVNRTATPADEHAAARDSIAITCNHESDFYNPIGRVREKN